MKTIQLFTVILFLSAGSLLAQDAKTSKPAKPTAAPSRSQTTSTMPRYRYLVTIPHSKEQCKDVMNEMKAKGDPFLGRFSWGCKSGDHTAYAFYDAVSEESVRKSLPVELQSSARLQKLDRMTATDIEQMHKTAK